MIYLIVGIPESPHSSITRGYGTDAQGRKLCYDCCAERDKKEMRETGRIVLYLTENPNTSPAVSNWPASLKINVSCLKKGRHNMAGNRYDVWFYFEGREWHGVQYGDNTQICHCRRMKEQVRHAS